jgi:hypothetical protein
VQPSGIRNALTRGARAEEILIELNSMRIEFQPQDD